MLDNLSFKSGRRGELKLKTMLVVPLSIVRTNFLVVYLGYNSCFLNTQPKGVENKYLFRPFL